ncbi:hypothetical protein [Streptomyces sp. NPDC059611]|uniref:hypothetical protein n=1 Tax=Streptomyces sp. NPDC059611 TaxID=3346884 RepID=UPI0036A93D0A
MPGAEVVKVRANPQNWNQAELLDAYTWPQHQGDRLDPIDRGTYPDDPNHTSLVIGEFLSQYQQLPAVRLLQACGTAHTFLIEVARPSWELAGGESQ